MIKRAIQAAILGYILLGIITRIMEWRGDMVCGCSPDCWCKKPGLSVFRWVFPRWHKGEATVEVKAALG